MDEIGQAPEDGEVSELIDLAVLVAERVRTDSRHQARLTPVDELAALLGGLESAIPEVDEYEPGETAPSVGSEGTGGPTGASAESEAVEEPDAGMSPDAPAEGEGDGDTEEAAEDASSRAGMARLAICLTDMAGDEGYADIQSISDSAGRLYLYSERHMSGRYAQILARSVADDPCGVIADTVREESRIYPRPTRVDLFAEPVYGIAPVDLDASLDRLFASETYSDIKRLTASTGAEYLYSDRHLTADWARSLVESLELDYHENP